jgi:hypothetical protein
VGVKMSAEEEFGADELDSGCNDGTPKQLCGSVKLLLDVRTVTTVSNPHPCDMNDHIQVRIFGKGSQLLFLYP